MRGERTVSCVLPGNKAYFSHREWGHARAKVMKKKRTQNELSRNRGKAAAMFAPAIALLSVFFIGPVLMTLTYSMTNMSLSGAAAKNFQFVGFDNFLNLFKQPGVGEVIYNTLIFLLFSGIIGQQVLGFILAMLMKKRVRGVKMFVGLSVSAGWIAPEAVAIVLFSCVLAPKGLLNSILGLFGIDPLLWLIKYSLVSIIIANTWKGCAYSMMMFQAALDGIPEDIMDAAEIDGAGFFQKLFRITIPMIKGNLTTNFMVITMRTLGTLGLVRGLTGGGPGRSSTTLSLLMYQRAFGSYQIGFGMAISVILLVAGVLLSVIYARIVGREKK